MTIAPHAFYNCVSLSIIDFSACNSACRLGIYQDNIDLNQISVIVKDEFYEQQKKLESPFINIIKQSDLALTKALEEVNVFQSADIMKSIYMLQLAKKNILEVDLLKAINTILKFLEKKYNITSEMYNSFKQAFDKYNTLKEAKNE